MLDGEEIEIIYELQGDEPRQYLRIYSPDVEGNYREQLGKDMLIEVCPLGIITDETRAYINLYHLCKSYSSLPLAGSVLEQDNKTFEAFQVIEGEINAIQEYERERKSQTQGSGPSGAPPSG